MTEFALAHPYLAFMAFWWGALMLQEASPLIRFASGCSREDLDRAQSANERGLKEVADALERLSIITVYHDATCRGKSPEAIGSTEELLRIIKGKSKRR